MCRLLCWLRCFNDGQFRWGSHGKNNVERSNYYELYKRGMDYTLYSRHFYACHPRDFRGRIFKFNYDYCAAA